MEEREHDIAVLKKILNSELFLGKFPIIDRVAVGPYNKKIDIVLIPNNTKKYFEIRKEIDYYIWNLVKMAGVKTGYEVYP